METFRIPQGGPVPGQPVSASPEAAQTRPDEPCVRPPGLAQPARRFARFLYSSNPFYILSADLVFVGLRISCSASRSPSQAWALLLGLATYTLLLAATACILIRLGKLWDDLRSLLVLVVIMFFAIAMNCDDSMAANAQRGALGYIGGFVFAVVVTESVLHTIRLRLPGWYRLAYYLILALVFLYPLALGPLLGDPDRPALQWALFGFSPLAALAVAALVPAARGGPALVAENGSPWRWPMYPWSLFFVMVIGLGVRANSLCVSFHYVVGSRTIFGPYFLVPIGLAVSLVWLEIGKASRRREVMIAACGLPLFLALLATLGSGKDAVNQRFLAMFSETLGGSPFFLSLVASMLFAAVAVLRGVPRARELLAFNLALLAVVGPRSADLHHLTAPRSLPLLASGLILGREALRLRSTGRGTIASFLLMFGMISAARELWPAADLRSIEIHLGVSALVLVGLVFQDELGRLIGRSGAVILAMLAVSAASGYPRALAAILLELSSSYPLLIAVACFALAYVERERIYLASSAVSATSWLASLSLGAYDRIRKVVAGIDQIAWGMLFFLIALSISLRKADLWRRGILRACLGQLLRKSAFSGRAGAGGGK
jgi:hypothetical protein